jgi:hypothetical protein
MLPESGNRFPDNSLVNSLESITFMRFGPAPARTGHRADGAAPSGSCFLRYVRQIGCVGETFGHPLLGRSGRRDISGEFPRDAWLLRRVERAP